jgi:hypothetical protein
MNRSDRYYFGTKPAFFKLVDGTSTIFTESEWCLDNSPTAKENALALQEKIVLDGIEYPIAVPGIPAIDYVKRHCDLPVSPIAQPDLLRLPLLKCPESESIVTYTGIASGVRSGLVKVDSTWYRLKGCGNNADGFLMKVHCLPATDGSGEKRPAWQELRGCAFPQTTSRELMITSQLSRVLEPQGVLSANTSVGFASYSHPLCPHIQPTCIITETKGDRRFGTHVLAGVELILPLLLNIDAIDVSKLSSLFPEMRPGRESTTASDMVTTGSYMSDYLLGTFTAGHDRDCKGLCWPDLERDGSTLANMISPEFALPFTVPEVCSCGDSVSYPCQWTREGPIDMTDEWKAEWDITCNELKECLSRVAGVACAEVSPCLVKDGSVAASSLVLGYLFSRCGYDAGRILRGIHGQRLSWGTYQDGLCRRDWDEWHCNAHANNLVVVPESSIPADHPGAHSFLSFLDLDMAFAADDFIDVDTGAVGVSYEFFSNVQWKEHVSLMEVLAGSDSSTGVPKVAASVIAAQSNEVAIIKSSLYDTIIMGYLGGYMDDIEKFPVMVYDDNLQAAAHCVIRLAIIVMADYIA